MHKKKSFNDIWDIIDISVYILIGYALLDLFFSISTHIQKVFPAAIVGVLLTIVAFGSIGYISSKEKEDPKTTARYGAYAGLIIGFITAIIGIISFYVYPEKMAEAIMKAVEAGADAAMIQTIMKITTYANLVIGPAINAGIGALIAWLGSLIFKKKFEGKRK